MTGAFADSETTMEAWRSLIKAPSGRAATRKLGGQVFARENPRHAPDRGRQRRDAGPHHRMAKRDQAIALDARHRADRGGIDVTADELHADGAALFVVLGGVGVDPPATARLERLETERREELARHTHGDAAHAAHEDGRGEPPRHALRLAEPLVTCGELLGVARELIVTGRTDVAVRGMSRASRRRRGQRPRSRGG